jgi:hypothetical protein
MTPTEKIIVANLRNLRRHVFDAYDDESLLACHKSYLELMEEGWKGLSEAAREKVRSEHDYDSISLP